MVDTTVDAGAADPTNTCNEVVLNIHCHHPPVLILAEWYSQAANTDTIVQYVFPALHCKIRGLSAPTDRLNRSMVQLTGG